MGEGGLRGGVSVVGWAGEVKWCRLEMVVMLRSERREAEEVREARGLGTPHL